MVNYREFKFTEVFVHERGKRYKKEDHTPGEIAYISSTAKNNGLDNFVSPPETMKIYKNRMTLSNSGSIGYCFYHNYEFVASDHVMVVWLKKGNLTENIALYLKPILENIRYKYGFGREINEKRLKSETFLLPVDNLSNPNWDFMEAYIEDLKNKVNFEPIESRNKFKENEINLRKWKTFKLNDVFEIIESTKGTTTFELIPGNDIPYIGAKKTDNGFVMNVSLEGNERFVSKGNCIVFIHLGDGSGGYSTYQEEDFIGMNGKTSCGYHHKLNKFSALFLITMLDKERYRYSFGRSWSGQRFNNSEILLPFDENGEPDWDFMETFIKKLNYGEKL